MKIYSTDDTIILDAPVTKEAYLKNALMGDHYIELPFSLREQMRFARGSYIIYDGHRYKIKDIVNPEFDNNTGGYKYALRFWARQNDMKDAIVFWPGSSVLEASFHDTTDLASFGNLIANSMNSFERGAQWKVADVPADLERVTKLVSFNGDTCWNAVNIISEAFDVEWWTVENGDEIWLHFGKLEFGTEETFKRGDAVKSIPARRGDDSDYGTRFYAFGSTRNIPRGYYTESEGATTNHVSEKRLHLPDGRQYVDAYTPLAQDDIIEQVVFFEDIYPKNTETVTSYETIDRKVEGAEDQSATFDAYVMYCKDTPFLPSDVFENETLRCLFTSGSLQGREFELALIEGDPNHTVIEPDKWKPEDGFNKKFEIIADQEDAGGEIPLIIPNSSLHPEPGDTFILTGVRLPDERIEEAEHELLEAAVGWAAKNSSDTSIYDCPTNPVYCMRNDKNYDLGQKVLLLDDRFGEAGRSSRIQGYEKKLHNVYDATYTVGDNTAYSRFGSIEKEITEAAYAERIGVANGKGIYVIRSKYDTTQPTDYNVYSALASDSKYFDRMKGGKILGDISFAGDITSENYRKGIFEGAGFGIVKDENGGYILEVDKLNVRKEATFNELAINQISFSSGETVFSVGGCEITSVEDIGDVYRCHYDNKNGRRYSGIIAGDQVRCQRYDNARQSIVKYYWRLVTSIGDDYIDISKTDCDGTGIPEEGDNLVQFGNRTVIERQSAIIINPLEAGSVTVLAHINSYDLTDREYIGLGVDKTTGEAYMLGYGDFFLGSRDRSTYVTYEKGNNEKKIIKVRGSMSITSGSSGLENLDEWAGKQAQIDNAQQTADEAKSRIKDLQDQIDGVIESWNGFGAPTLSNYPANEWTTDAERQRHDRDIYTDITPYADDATTPTSGQSWKWYYNSPADYGWTKIADSEAVKALQLAQMSVLGTDVLYKQNSSATSAGTLPTLNAAGEISNPNGWSTTAPQWASGKYMWQTTYVRKGDGGASFSDPTCLTGATGATGAAGKDGSNGKDGSSYTENLLLKSNEVVSMNDSSASKTYNFGGVKPASGEKLTVTIWGNLGTGNVFKLYIYNTGLKKEFALNNIAKVSTGVYTLQYNQQSYFGNTYIKVTAEKSSTSATLNSRIDKIKVESGYNDNPVWTPNSSEMSAPAITEEYYKSTSHTALSGGSWQDTNPGWSADHYIWTRTKMTYDTGAVEYSDPICVTGVPGNSVLARYSADGASWHASYQSGDIWMQTSSNNGATWSEAVRIVGQKGDKGDTGNTGPTGATGPAGADGAPGKDGQYQMMQWAKNGSSGTAPTSGWEDTPMTADAGEYVWMRTGTVVPPAASPASWKPAVRLTGDKGTDGTSTYLLDLSDEVIGMACDAEGTVTGTYPSPQATVWKGSQKVTSGITYSIASRSGISTASVNTSGKVTLNNLNMDTASVVVKAVVDGVTLQASISLYKVIPGATGPTGPTGATGADGDDGADAVVYSILPSVDSVTRKEDGTADVTSVGCAKYKTTGSSTALTTDHYLFAALQNESDISSFYLVANTTKSTGSISIADDTIAIIFELRTDFSTSSYTVLDRERVPVFADSLGMQKQLSDLEYLKTALPDGSETVAEGGLVLANIIGVRETGSENVESFLNGSDIGKDSTHGKLILAGGIPSGTDTLDARAKNANTRIYEDGSIKTTELIADDGVKIGKFTVHNQYLEIKEKTTQSNGDWKGYTTALEQDAFYIAAQKQVSSIKNSGYTYIDTSYSMSSISKAIMDFDGASVNLEQGIHSKLVYECGTGVNTVSQAVGISAEMSSTMYSASGTKVAGGITNLIGVYASATGGTNNYAFYSPKGVFGGLRPNVKRIQSTSNTTLTAYDHTVIVYRSGSTAINATVYLPAMPENGQEYVILKRAADTLVLRPNGKQILKTDGGSIASTGYDTFSGNEIELHLVYYAASNAWFMTYHYYAAS